MTSPTKNAVLAVLTLVVIALGTFAWRQHRQITELQQAAARSSVEQSATQQRLASAEKRAVAAEKARAEADAASPEPRSRPAGAVTRADAPRIRSNAVNPLDNPATQQLMATSIKSSLDQRYGGLFRQLKLSPAELDKFKELLAERQMSAIDVMRALQTQGGGVPPNPADMPALLSKAQGEVDQSVRTLLGDQRFQQYQDFNQNINSYSVLDQVERRLSYTNAPLQESQSASLLRVLVEDAQAAPSANPMAAFAQAFGGGNAIVSAMTQRPLSDEAITRAQTILSPAQTEVLRQIQAEQKSQAEMMQSMRGNAAAAGTGGMIFSVPAGASPAPPPPKQ